MPDLQEYREAHYHNTGKVSDNVRTLAISAIGIIWIFRTQSPEGIYQVPEALFLPVKLVFIAMALDFAQYIYGSIAWWVFFRINEYRGVKETDELFAPTEINFPTYLLFYGKVGVIGFAYFYLISFLFSSVNWV